MKSNSRKGITPLISIVILLLIAVAIAGTSYLFISNYWSGLISNAIEVTSADCTATGVRLYIHNIGDAAVKGPAAGGTGGSFQISRTVMGGTPEPGAMALTADVEINPQATGIITDGGCTKTNVGATCKYDVIVSGRKSTISATC